MKRNNKLINLNNAIYILLKDYGFIIDIYRVNETVDLKTGRKVTQRQKYHINKALLLPNAVFRDFTYAILRNPDIRGTLDVSERHVLINQKYLPRGFELRKEDYIIFNNKKYEIVLITSMELADFWYLRIKQVEGQVKYEIHDRKLRSRFKMTSTFSYER